MFEKYYTAPIYREIQVNEAFLTSRTFLVPGSRNDGLHLKLICTQKQLNSTINALSKYIAKSNVLSVSFEKITFSSWSMHIVWTAILQAAHL